MIIAMRLRRYSHDMSKQNRNAVRKTNASLFLEHIAYFLFIKLGYFYFSISLNLICMLLYTTTDLKGPSIQCLNGWTNGQTDELMCK